MTRHNHDRGQQDMARRELEQEREREPEAGQGPGHWMVAVLTDAETMTTDDMDP